MISVIQRVQKAAVTVQTRRVGYIKKGVLIFLAIAKEDTEQDIEYLVRKIVNLRIFEDAAGKMNLSASEVKAEFLVVSQFTLLGDCAKGNRPSFERAADPVKAEKFYLQFIDQLRLHHFKVETGEFRAMMNVSLVNDGPVTFILSSS